MCSEGALVFMRNIYSIFKREVLSFFVSPVAYFVITGFLLLGAYFFFNLLAYFNLVITRYNAMPYHSPGQPSPNLNQWVLEPFFQTMILILVFLIPLLTMRILAEERRSGTFELLLTSPLSVFEIVMGKFLSLFFTVALMCSFLFIFPLLLWLFGDPGPEVMPMFSGFLAVILSGLAFASVGMAVSSFTENQIVAGISSMVVLLLLYVIQSPAESIGGVGQEVLEYLSPVMQARELIKGVVSVSTLIYFSTLITLGIFISQRALDAQRWR